MRVSLVLALLLALNPLVVGGASAQAQESFSHEEARERVNRNLLMLLGGTLGGPWIRLAQDISTVVSAGDKLRVLPLAGGGGKSNLRDVLLARGVDLGITRVDVLNDAKATGEFGPNLAGRIAYVTPLAVDMLQVLARPEIKSVQDLHGKKVNILPKGSVATKILKELGVVIDEVNRTIPDGIEGMRAGEYYATACVCSVPIPAYAGVDAKLGFRLLEIPYIEAVEESFLPASLSSEIYPNLIPMGSKVHTVGAHLVLITYNWKRGSDRYRKVEKFTEAFFSNFDKLRQPPRHPSWRRVNISATIRNWRRFPAAHEWLVRQQQSAAKREPQIDRALARAQAARAAGGDKAKQERLFKEFLEWSRNRQRP